MSSKNIFISSTSTNLSLNENHIKEKCELSLKSESVPARISRNDIKYNTVNCKLSKYHVRRKKNRKSSNSLRKCTKFVTFDIDNFVQIIKVESYKKYNIDTSKQNYKEDKCKCSCFIF